MKYYKIFYFQRTYDCNLRCAHCFQESGPERKDTTMSEDNFRKVIDHLPERIKLNLTGGEIFKDMNRLWKDLDYITETKNDLELVLQTNGFWATDEIKTKEILEKLYQYKVYKLDITSQDSYHEKAGLNPKVLKNLVVGGKKYNLISDHYIRGASENKKYIFPVGRGKNVFDKKNFYFPQDECKKVFEGNELTIDPKGNSYMCCFNLFKLPGNFINNSYEEIIEMAKEDKELKTLNEEGIVGLALLRGYDKSKIAKIVKNHGRCGLCVKLNGLAE